MSWWQWLLVSIGGYLLAGFATACAASYIDGRQGRNFNPTESALNTLLWPIPVIAGTVILGPAWIVVWFNGRGGTWSERRTKRASRSEFQKEWEDLCEREGWDPKKVKPKH